MPTVASPFAAAAAAAAVFYSAEAPNPSIPTAATAAAATTAARTVLEEEATEGKEERRKYAMEREGEEEVCAVCARPAGRFEPLALLTCTGSARPPCLPPSFPYCHQQNENGRKEEDRKAREDEKEEEEEVICLEPCGLHYHRFCLPPNAGGRGGGREGRDEDGEWCCPRCVARAVTPVAAPALLGSVGSAAAAAAVEKVEGKDHGWKSPPVGMLEELEEEEGKGGGRAEGGEESSRKRRRRGEEEDDQGAGAKRGGQGRKEGGIDSTLPPIGWRMQRGRYLEMNWIDQRLVREQDKISARRALFGNALPSSLPPTDTPSSSAAAPAAAATAAATVALPPPPPPASDAAFSSLYSSQPLETVAAYEEAIKAALAAGDEARAFRLVSPSYAPSHSPLPSLLSPFHPYDVRRSRTPPHPFHFPSLPSYLFSSFQ